MYSSWIFASWVKPSRAKLDIHQAEPSQAGCFLKRAEHELIFLQCGMVFLAIRAYYEADLLYFLSADSH